MSDPDGNQYGFSSKPDRRFLLSKGLSQGYREETPVFSSANNLVNSQMPDPMTFRSSGQNKRLRTLPVKVEQNPAAFSNSSLHQQQNASFSRQSNNNNIGQQHQPQQQILRPTYTNLTSWTTKFTSQQTQQFPPSNPENIYMPMMSDPQSTLPGSIPLTSRVYKASPYQNAFSRMSPLHPHPTSKLKTVNGNQPDAMATVLPMNSSGQLVLKSLPSQENRFKRTAEALHKSGLWDVAMKTGKLIRRNQDLQKELEQFKMDALNFLKSVIKNPENGEFIKTVLNNALSARSAEGKKSSVMTVVVSAAAAAAAALKYESSTTKNVTTNSDGACDGIGGTDCVSDNISVSDMKSSISNTSLGNHTSTSTSVV